MVYKKIIAPIGLLLLLGLAGCSDKSALYENQDIGKGIEECVQDGVAAPKWTCLSEIDGFYSTVGIAQKSSAGLAYMRKVALANGRSELAHQIQTLVKDKITIYAGTTGNGANETVDSATETITKQVANVDLSNSKAIDVWTSPSGDLYMLVTTPKDGTNEQIRKNLQTSYNNQDALWQQFKSKNALEDLEKEFQ
ncbi:MAG: LPP20 family lipoprotein [Sulfurimonas sp.]|jgi:hypothetical protein|nr:LPP20 family lipoprotein [Sulfurimonadaceae bacterium]